MTPQVILDMGPETIAANPPFDTTKDTWAKDLVHGQTTGPLGTQLEWTSVRNPSVDDDGGWDGLSGTAVVVGTGLSGGDNPFFHPFGDDWEFYIAPDPPFQWMTARSLTVNSDYVTALCQAKAELPGFQGRNVIGVEIDRNLVPVPYRVLDGDRICVWGRWIVDTGHDDFHTEIHPPVLLAGARAVPGNSPGLPNSTYSTIIGRPYMVTQHFDDGELFTHLKNEIKKVEIPVPFIGSAQVEAHPVVLPNAFSGVGFVNYIVRPPTPRQFPGDVLMARFHFTVRTGIGVQVADIGDAVMVYVTFNDTLHKRAPLPKKSDRIVSESDLRNYSATASDVFIGLEILNLFADPLAAVWLARGIKTDLYNAPLAQSTHDKEVTQLAVASLPKTTPVAVDDQQPFPIYGYLALEWERPIAVWGQNPFQTRGLETATTFAPEADGIWLVSDYDRDGLPDLCLIKTSNTTSGTVEVHIASGASNYQTRVLETATTFAPEADGIWLIADYDRDGIPDLCLIKTSNTTSATVEVHIASGASKYQARVLETATTFAPEADGVWLMVDYDRDGIPDLCLVKTGNTTSGTVEVHIASGASKYQTRVLETATTFAPEADGVWLMADFDGDGVPDLCLIKTSNTPSGAVEVHIASGASNYQTRILETATTFAPEADGVWLMADYNRDGIPDLCLVKTSNTTSGTVEVHIAQA